MTVDTQGVSSSAPSAADRAYTSSGGHSRSVSFNSAIAGICALADALQGLQGAVAAWATVLNENVVDASDQVTEQSTADTQAIEDAPPANDTSKNADSINAERQKNLTNLQAKAQTDSTIGNTEVQERQSEADAAGTLVTTIAQQIAMLYSWIGSMIQGYSSIRT